MEELPTNHTNEDEWERGLPALSLAEGEERFTTEGTEAQRGFQGLEDRPEPACSELVEPAEGEKRMATPEPTAKNPARQSRTKFFTAKELRERKKRVQMLEELPANHTNEDEWARMIPEAGRAEGFVRSTLECGDSYSPLFSVSTG